MTKAAVMYAYNEPLKVESVDLRVTALPDGRFTAATAVVDLTALMETGIVKKGLDGLKVLAGEHLVKVRIHRLDPVLLPDEPGPGPVPVADCDQIGIDFFAVYCPGNLRSNSSATNQPNL